MKKRFKLITTIASLCLAVALMAFGVYAATINDLVVSGTVNFGATEIDGNWETLTVTLGNGEFEDGQGSKTYAKSDLADFTEAVGAITVLDIDEACTIEIKATFTNTSNAVDAKITATSEVAGTEDYTFVETTNTPGSSAKNSGATEACTVVLTLNVTDKAQSVNGIPFTVTFSVAPNA